MDTAYIWDTHTPKEIKAGQVLQEAQAPEMWVPTKLIAMSQGVDCGDGFSTFDVPIFTEEFLDQNKGEIFVGAGVLVGRRLEMRMRTGVRTEVSGAQDGGGMKLGMDWE